MTGQMMQYVSSSLPQWLSNRLRRSRAVRRLVVWWVRGHDVKISKGVGAGLRLNAGPSNPAYALGTNELPVQEALAHHLQPGHIFYDIGANVGFFTVIGARLVGPTGHVYAFEPVPENVAFVRKNVALNNFSNVTVFERAVSQSSGKGELLVSHYSGGATLSPSDAPSDLKGVIAVDLISIDELIAQQGLIPPTVVKIDVEGAEMEVLKGMIQTIEKYRPIIIYELDDGDEQTFRRKQRECDTFIQGFGYKLTLLADSYPRADWIVSHTVAIPKSGNW